jgi:hypothetical protein
MNDRIADQMNTALRGSSFLNAIMPQTTHAIHPMTQRTFMVPKVHPREGP